MIQFLLALQGMGAAAATGLATATTGLGEAIAGSGVGKAVIGAGESVVGGATDVGGGLKDIAGGVKDLDITGIKGGMSGVKGGLSEMGSGLTDITDSATKAVDSGQSKLSNAYKESKFGKSGFAKGTGLDGLLDPSGNPNIAAHSQPKPLDMDDGVDSFMRANQNANNQSVNMMSSQPSMQGSSIPYAYSSPSSAEETAALYDQQTANAVAEVIAADQTLPDAPLVQPTNYEHGSLYSPRKDVISVDDFINNRGR